MVLSYHSLFSVDAKSGRGFLITTEHLYSHKASFVDLLHEHIFIFKGGWERSIWYCAQGIVERNSCCCEDNGGGRGSQSLEQRGNFLKPVFLNFEA